MKFMQITRFIVLLAIVFFVYQNFETVSHLNSVITEPIKTKLAILLVLNLFTGIFAGMLLIIPAYKKADNKLKEYQRKLEKTSVQSSEDSSKVSVLQAKIEVLEKALKSALDKN